MSSPTPAEIPPTTQHASHYPTSDLTTLPSTPPRLPSPDSRSEDDWESTTFLPNQPQSSNESDLDPETTTPELDPENALIRDTLKLWRNRSKRASFRQFMHGWFPSKKHYETLTSDNVYAAAVSNTASMTNLLHPSIPAPYARNSSN
ncbi:hypothetical protein PspLS_11623 [Pyricularia sp. CBS 133598]|nr:hypothetical protein PspLS_11623 [Pyricularia sp. CBS 133598]